MMKTPQGKVLVSFIIPAHNESKVISATADAVFQLLKKKVRAFELIVVDDGSTDNTFEVMQGKEKSLPGLKVIRSGKNMGKGAALSKAFSVASGKFVFYSDADLSIGLGIFDEMLSSLQKGADVAVASKHLPLSKVQYPFFRKLSSGAFSNLAGLLLGLPVRDTQCGLKGFRNEVICEIQPKVKDNGWFWDTEFLARAHWAGKSIAEIPAEVKQGVRDSNLHILHDSFIMGKALLKLFFEKAGGMSDGKK